MRTPPPETASLPYFNGSAPGVSVPETSHLLDEEFGLLDLDHAFWSCGPDLLDPLGHTPGKRE